MTYIERNDQRADRLRRGGVSRAARPFAAALAGLLLVSAGGCSTNPATGETQLSLIGEQQEIEMGRQAAQQVEASIGLVDDQELQGYVSRIGQRLAAASERPDLPWSFKVVDDPGVNAFALPGGFIYVTRGIMATFMSEAELAAVLGHEIGHVTARHSVEQLSQQQLYGGLAAVGVAVFDLGSVAQGLLGGSLQLLFLKYSRDDERQADELGLRYMTRENYEPREMLDVFATLHRVSAASGGGGTPGWLSTHPAPEDRFERIAAHIDSDTTRLTNPLVERDVYLQHVDRLVYGQDPRNGYFRNGTLFLHPELRFSIQFPTSWQTQNMAQAVVAGSPQRDAVMQLTLSGASSSGAALNEFGSQQGVQMGRSSQTSINGLPASIAQFDAVTDQGPLRGVAAFIEYGGNVYQVLGYSKASGYASYQATFDRTIGSFDRLTDPSAINVEPRRLDIVRVSSPMSVDEFAQRNQTSVDVQTLALINGLDPGERLDSGLWKRVVGKTLTGN